MKMIYVPKWEVGKYSSENESFVFIRFGGGSTSQACRREDVIVFSDIADDLCNDIIPKIEGLLKEFNTGRINLTDFLNSWMKRHSTNMTGWDWEVILDHFVKRIERHFKDIKELEITVGNRINTNPIPLSDYTKNNAERQLGFS